jgi:soluble P-type ATPase
MIDVDIPGFGRLALTCLLCDFNGTLARDGRLLDDARTLLPEIAKQLSVRIVTGDTFGSAVEQLQELPCALTRLEAQEQAVAKLALVEAMGPEHVVAIGNGRNDRLMLARVALGVAVLGDEGAARQAVDVAHVVTRDIKTALELLLDTRRLVATLRS